MFSCKNLCGNIIKSIAKEINETCEEFVIVWIGYKRIILGVSRRHLYPHCRADGKKCFWRFLCTWLNVKLVVGSVFTYQSCKKLFCISFITICNLNVFVLFQQVSHGAIQFTAYEELRKIIVDLKSKKSTSNSGSSDTVLVYLYQYTWCSVGPSKLYRVGNSIIICFLNIGSSLAVGKFV